MTGAYAAAAEVAYENTADEAWPAWPLISISVASCRCARSMARGWCGPGVGNLPRCGHESTSSRLHTSIVSVRGGRGLWSALTGRDVPAAAVIPDSVEVGCGLRAGPSKARPGQATGCGVSFRLPTARPDPPRTSRGPPQDLPGTCPSGTRHSHDLGGGDADRSAGWSVQRVRPSVRRAGERGASGSPVGAAAWRTGLTALITLVTTGISKVDRHDQPWLFPWRIAVTLADRRLRSWPWRS